MPESRRSQRRHRHQSRSHSAHPRPRNPQSYHQEFATAGEERAGLRNPARDPKSLTDFEPSKGEGFGIGPGHGPESSAQGLEGSPREREYRGNAGTTFGAVVGPDALKPDTAEDDKRRPDPNRATPEQVR